MLITEKGLIVWSKVLIMLAGETYYPVSAIGQVDLAGKNMLTWLTCHGLTARLGRSTAPGGPIWSSTITDPLIDTELIGTHRRLTHINLQR